MVSSQELSVDDIHAMESELKGLSEGMDRASAIRDRRRKTLIASEKELMTVCNSLEVILAEYNSRLSDLQLDPENASMLAKLKASLKKDNLKDTDQSKILGVNISKTVNPTIGKLTDSFRNKVQETKASYQDSLDRIAAAEDACKAAEAKLQIVHDKTAKCKETLQSEQATHDAKLAVRVREVDAMDSKVAARRDLVTLAFFFLLRVGEYTPAPRAKRTVPLRRKDVILFKDGAHLAHSAPLATLLGADALTVRLAGQKNGLRNVHLHHIATGDPCFCPVRAAARRVHALQVSGERIQEGDQALPSSITVGTGQTGTVQQ
jgi:hypothetical protein